MPNRTARKTVPITERALLQRINRKLVHDDQIMKRARHLNSDLGWIYVVDRQQNAVVAAHCDIEAWGRAMDCLAAYESLEG